MCWSRAQKLIKPRVAFKQLVEIRLGYYSYVVIHTQKHTNHNFSSFLLIKGDYKMQTVVLIYTILVFASIIVFCRSEDESNSILVNGENPLGYSEKEKAALQKVKIKFQTVLISISNPGNCVKAFTNFNTFVFLVFFHSFVYSCLTCSTWTTCEEMTT